MNFKLVSLALLIATIAHVSVAAKPDKPMKPNKPNKPNKPHTPPQSFSAIEFRTTKVLVKTLAKASVTDRPTFGTIIRTSKGLLKAIQAQGGCKVDVCFALDGEKSVSAPAYELQKLFVAMTGAMVSWDVTTSTAAVQYGTSTKAITALTSDRASFLKAVGKSRYVRQPKANMSGALAYCWAQVRRAKNVKKSVVVVGSGKATAGFLPKIVLDVMRREGAEVYGVSTAGGKNALVKVMSARGKDVVSLYGDTDLPVALQTIVSQLCGLKA